MHFVDLLLNLAGMLLWLGWRAIGLAGPVRAPGLSLASTLQRAATPPVRRWPPLAWLVGLLLARPFLYWLIGAPAHWSPGLGLGLLSVAFRATSLAHMLLYSALSFGRVWVLFHLALLFVGLVNGRDGGTGAVQRFVRLQLGAVGLWSGRAQILFVIGATVLIWLALSPLLIALELLAPAGLGVRLQQGLLLGVGACLSWTYLVAVLLAAYLFHSHVFLGPSDFWDWVGTTGRNVLRPLRALPLVVARLDLAPLVGILLALAGGHLARLGLTRWFQAPPF